MFNLPRDERSSVADWIELELAMNVAIDTMSKATVASVIEQQTGKAADEGLITDIWRLLERRAELYRTSPFSVEGNLVIRSGEVPVTATYLACLFFSLYGVRTKRSDPKILERIAAICIAEYLGGQSYVFGWPPMDDVPTQIPQRIEDLATKMREKLAEYPSGKYKDRGVDVVSWKSFQAEGSGEHRSGQVAILSQCAAGQDWAKKKGDVPLDAWKQYIHWANAPIRGFVVPGVIQDENWHDTSVDCGLVFDRARICNYLPDPFPDADLLASIRTWIADEKAEAAS
jgi:hypothetical protein